MTTTTPPDTTYTLGDTWIKTAECFAFGHTVRFYQSGTAVIMEVDGLCFIGDAAMVFGEPKMVFPKVLAISPDLAHAQSAVELTFEIARQLEREQVARAAAAPDAPGADRNE